MYKIMNVQWKIAYNRAIDSSDLWKIFNSLNVWNHENSTENYVHLMNR